jgi:hypothetical protein
VRNWEIGTAKTRSACFSFLEGRHSRRLENPGKVAAGDNSRIRPSAVVDFDAFALGDTPGPTLHRPPILLAAV